MIKQNNILKDHSKSKSYAVKEIYYTLQGEGAQMGKAAIFLRFSGCNLWSGLEKDRAKAICKFCDTAFFGTDGENGGKYSKQSLASKIDALWPQNAPQNKFVVCTGGEPALQLDAELIDAFHEKGFSVAIETNGTLKLPSNLDWVCVSPKADTSIVVTSGDELKLVFPQTEHTPEQFLHLDFQHFYLQPKDDNEREINTKLTMQYCLENPQWKLSIQSHKYLDIK